MQYQSLFSGCSECCPECTGVMQSHCLHCPKRGQSVAAQVPDGYDYSHLVGDPAKQDEQKLNTVRFEELLTDYDRILLEFGMRISTTLM